MYVVRKRGTYLKDSQHGRWEIVEMSLGASVLEVESLYECTQLF